jgi:hypothetical protein
MNDHTDAAHTTTPAAINSGAGIHFILQGKGGVGKSLAASILGQYFQFRGVPCRCIDTDPVNQTFTQYKGLNARHLKLMADGQVDTRVFDGLVDEMMEASESFVVDNGASTFIPLWHYIIENRVVETLQNVGKSVYVHSVVTGGQALLDTLSGFDDVARTTPAQNLVVWINEFFGPVVQNGKTFKEMKVFAEHVDRLRGVVTIPRRSADTFGRDVEEMLRLKITFDEAVAGKQFSIMSRQRLELIRRDLYSQLDELRFVEGEGERCAQRD